MSGLIRDYGVASVTAMVHAGLNSREESSLRGFKEAGVAMLECDLLRLPKSNLKPPRFDVVYHLAAYAETENPSAKYLVNSQGTLNLLSWLGTALTGKRLVYTGTLASVDRDFATGPISESTPCSPRTLYGKSKLLGEDYVREWQPKLGFNYTILRLCTILGNGFRPGGMFGVLPQKLVRGDFAVRLNWPGHASFLCMSDLVRILLTIPHMPQAANQTYVLSNGEQITFDELLDQMSKVLGSNRKRIVLPPWLWRLISWVAWRAVSSRMSSCRLHNFCWRVSNLIKDGLWADGSKLDSLLEGPYQSIADGLREIYGESFVQADRE